MTTTPANTTPIRPKHREAIIQSLRAGVVPRTGQQHIQVGRHDEVKALVGDIGRITDAGSAIRFIIGEYGSELVQDCVQMHGGIGVTFEHDVHLFLRRHTVDRALYGTPSEHRLRIVDLTEQQEGAA